MYSDDEEIDDTFVLGSSYKQNKSRSDELEKEIERLNSEIKQLQSKSPEAFSTGMAHSTPLTNADNQNPYSIDSGIASGRLTEDGLLNYRSSLDREQSTGLGARSKVTFDFPLERNRSKLRRDDSPGRDRYSRYKSDMFSEVDRLYPATEPSVVLPKGDENHVTVRKKRFSSPETGDVQPKFGDNASIQRVKNIIIPATYDGKGPWIDYKSHFDACAKLNRWTKEEKGLYLAVSLRGQAQGVLGNLPHAKRQDFDELVKSLEERFSPSNQTELYRTQLRERRQKAADTLPELGQDIRRLANLAYPTAPNDVRETLAKEQFIDALISADMRLRIKQARPTNLNDAVRHAVELEAFNKAEIKMAENQGC